MAYILPIVPLPVIIEYLRSLDVIIDGFSTRVATTHLYGNGGELSWDRKDMGLQIRLDPSEPHRYELVQKARLEITVFAQSYGECDVGYQRLLRVFRDFDRVAVSNAVIQRLQIETSPMQLFDPDVKMPTYLFFAETDVSEISTA